jgi:hypothetical protein
MSTVRWELYPLVAASALPRAWLQRQSHLQLAPNTVDASCACFFPHFSTDIRRSQHNATKLKRVGIEKSFALVLPSRDSLLLDF